VRDHGGIIECEPHERGSTFRVLLPMMREVQLNHMEKGKA
jgi:two-component system, NtrC family, nitrogen regulation sensor histidine kinase GlnL